MKNNIVSWCISPIVENRIPRARCTTMHGTGRGATEANVQQVTVSVLWFSKIDILHKLSVMSPLPAL